MGKGFDLGEFSRRAREMAAREAAAASGAGVAPGGGDDLRALVKRVNAENPSRADVAALRAALATGAGADLQAFTGLTLARQIVEAAGAKGAALAVVEAELTRLRADFGYKDSGPVERVLIDHALTCWARLQVAETKLTNFQSTGGSFAQGRYHEDALTAAQRRYLRAVGLLERLRRYAPPVTMVNIANQQIVSAGPGNPAEGAR